MHSATEGEFAAMLQRFGEGDREASEKLMAMLYAELHQLAERFMAKQPAGQTLQATALVSEAYLKLLGQRDPSWNSRKHLMFAAARAMRWVLVDHARRRANRKSIESETVALDSVLLTYENRAMDLLALEDALLGLAEISPKMARAVELRFFAGLTMDEVADALEMPKRRLEREWGLARAWLFERLSCTG